MRPCVMRLFVAPRYFFVALTLKLVGHPCPMLYLELFSGVTLRAVLQTQIVSDSECF